MKQTAVEWLLEYCERENWSIPFDVEHTAKEMEKEQIIKAYENTNSMAMYGEQYYNETFNK